MRSPLHIAPIRHLIPAALGLFVLSAVSGCFMAYDDPQREVSNPPDDAERLIGTYVLDQSERPGSPSGIGTRLKFFTGTHWMITQPDPETGQVGFHHGGRYVLDGDTITETVDFASDATASLIGRSFSLQIKVDNDTYAQADADGVYNETWKRLTPSQDISVHDGNP